MVVARQAGTDRLSETPASARRRICQRNMRKAGIDQSIRMKISGHKTDSMERRYNIVDIEDVKGAAKQMATWIKGEKDKT